MILLGYLRDYNVIQESMDSILFMNYVVEHFLSIDVNIREEDILFHKSACFDIISKYSNKVKSQRAEYLNKVSQIYTSQEVVNLLISYFLGEDWYVVDSLSTNQVNSIALIEIKKKYQGKMKYIDWVKFKKRY